jgi:hypothetical protein
VKYYNSASRDLGFQPSQFNQEKSQRTKKSNCTITYIYAIIIKLILFSEVPLLKSSMVLLLFLPLSNLSAIVKLHRCTSVETPRQGVQLYVPGFSWYFGKLVGEDKKFSGRQGSW